MNLAVIQARFSSSRLPGKVLKPLHGEAMLLQQIKRLKKAKAIDRLVVATSSQASDNPIEALCLEQGIDYFRGDLDDVLGRFYHCALKYNASNLIRLTGDCPLLDPNVVDAAIKLHLASGADYTSNCTERTYPDGQDVEVFTMAALHQAFGKAKKPSEREHVTPYIRENTDFSQAHLTQTADWSELRMSVDHPADFQFAETVYGHLYDANPDFSLADIVALLQAHPEIADINQGITYNEGYLKSLQQDKEQGFNS